jgi:hypothetical protein
MSKAGFLHYKVLHSGLFANIVLERKCLNDVCRCRKRRFITSAKRCLSLFVTFLNKSFIS